MLTFEASFKVPVQNLNQAIHVPAAATPAVVTLAATTGVRHIIHNIQWSYSAAPTGGRLTVVQGSTTILDLDITAAGPGGYNFTLTGAMSAAIVVTLASGAGAVVGKVNVQSSESVA